MRIARIYDVGCSKDKLNAALKETQDIAIQYELERAREHIEGFYATIYGTVEVETPDRRKAADEAVVVVKDPHDGRTWSAVCDGSGHYEIRDVILHKKCSPFPIMGQYQGERENARYTGPLQKPDKSHRFKKNLLISRAHWRAEITYTEKATIDDPADKALICLGIRITLRGRVKMPADTRTARERPTCV